MRGHETSRDTSAMRCYLWVDASCVDRSAARVTTECGSLRLRGAAYSRPLDRPVPMYPHRTGVVCATGTPQRSGRRPAANRRAWSPRRFSGRTSAHISWPASGLALNPPRRRRGGELVSTIPDGRRDPPDQPSRGDRNHVRGDQTPSRGDQANRSPQSKIHADLRKQGDVGGLGGSGGSNGSPPQHQNEHVHHVRQA